MALDTRVVEEVREMRTPGLDRAMGLITLLGEPVSLGLVGAGVAWQWGREQRQADVATAVLALVGGGAINQLLKTLFRRTRPALHLRRAHATGYSFPSGHAMTTLATYGTLAHLASRRGRLTGAPAARLLWGPVLALCLLIGGSRVYLEVHYPTDVVGGWAAATLWVLTCGLARSLMEPEEG